MIKADPDESITVKLNERGEGSSKKPLSEMPRDEESAPKKG